MKFINNIVSNYYELGSYRIEFYHENGRLPSRFEMLKALLGL